MPPHAWQLKIIGQGLIGPPEHREGENYGDDSLVMSVFSEEYVCPLVCKKKKSTKSMIETGSPE